MSCLSLTVAVSGKFWKILDFSFLSLCSFHFLLLFTRHSNSAHHSLFFAIIRRDLWNTSHLNNELKIDYKCILFDKNKHAGVGQVVCFAVRCTWYLKSSSSAVRIKLFIGHRAVAQNFLFPFVLHFIVTLNYLVSFFCKSVLFVIVKEKKYYNLTHLF